MHEVINITYINFPKNPNFSDFSNIYKQLKIAIYKHNNEYPHIFSLLKPECFSFSVL